MKKSDWTIQYLRDNNLIAYEYIRGSVAYGTNLVDENGNNLSDEDHGGVFIAPNDMLLGLRDEYVEQVADEKNDIVFYEFGRWIELLLKSNPTALESLFVPKDCIIGTVHPAVQYVIDHRDEFLSKECFKTFFGYAVSQIGKAQGLNKKCHIPDDMERKEVLDFCYTFKHQGSQPIKDWLAMRGLKQEYCGLVNVPNMKDTYAVFYDWGNHYKQEGYEECTDKCNDRLDDSNPKIDELKTFLYTFNDFTSYTVTCYVSANRLNRAFLYDKKLAPIGYRGIVAWSNDPHESNEVRLSSIPDKNATPICHIYYNKDAYTCHCRDYNEWVEWKAKRNPVRYENNLGHNYDSKNMMHCMRLTRMAKELAQGKGFNVRRTYDREYLLDIRAHKFSYEEIMAQVENEKKEMEEAVKVCTLPDKVDIEKVNNILIEARKQF